MGGHQHNTWDNRVVCPYHTFDAVRSKVGVGFFVQVAGLQQRLAGRRNTQGYRHKGEQQRQGNNVRGNAAHVEAGAAQSAPRFHARRLKHTNMEQCEGERVWSERLSE